MAAFLPKRLEEVSLPLLNAVYGEEVSLPLVNVAAFILASTLGGLIIAAPTYTIMKAFGLKLAAASTSLLWAAYWLAANVATGMVDVLVLRMDGLAAAAV